VRHLLKKLSNDKSVLHVTAHPDDEHGGVLTKLSRGEGARVALLSLTRGEAGANAIGSELFDGLGWIRAEELRVAGRYYGLDALYFTRLVDYGYSKRLDEAMTKWGREEALRDMVFVIRTDKPMVMISRFRGDARDGHGQHQFAGVMSRAAFHAAADPNVFPEQIADGLEPWQAHKLYVGGYSEDEDWTLAVDAGSPDPWLGDTYENVARAGLSLQRSQTSGIERPVQGAFFRYYRRVESMVDAPAKEASFFDGIAGPGEDRSLVDAFDPDHPERIVPTLADALSQTKPGRRRRLLERAITTALGLELTALAAPVGSFERTTNPFSPPPTLTVVAPGHRFEVRVSASYIASSSIAVRLGAPRIVAPPGWEVSERGQDIFSIRVPDDAQVWKPHVTRLSIAESHYRGQSDWFRGAPAAPLRARVTLDVEGVSFQTEVMVTGKEPALPNGYLTREIDVLPEISIELNPSVVLARDVVEVEVELRHLSGTTPVDGVIELDVPEGFDVSPVRAPVRVAGGRTTSSFSLSVPERLAEQAFVQAKFHSADRTYTDGYRVIAHRDLATRYQVTKARAVVIAPELVLPESLHVGYVMGVGDDVPEALEQLGARVVLLDGAQLAGADLTGYDTIVLGTRAYAVRADLREHNGRLLDYVEQGGNLVVLYNTPELIPDHHAPFAGTLPRRSEEVSEEDAPVAILDANAPVLRWPNVITLDDFDGWVEQRGSKFWSQWDDAYVALIESHDAAQSPQRGGWLQAAYGEGSYTYFAYALHRQLPYGVPGAYRILANLLSIGRLP